MADVAARVAWTLCQKNWLDASLEELEVERGRLRVCCGCSKGHDDKPHKKAIPSLVIIQLCHRAATVKGGLDWPATDSTTWALPDGTPPGTITVTW